jgi:hypothetical protein
MGVKEWLGIGSLIITLLGFAIFQGKLIERVDLLEAKSMPDIKPLETQIQINNAEIKVLQTQVRQLELENSNPLGR